MPALPGLHDTFSEEGVWWIPGREAHTVTGTVTYSPEDGATLRLLGFIQDTDVSIMGFAGGGVARSTIWGRDKKGVPITILDAYNSSRQLNVPGIPNETWVSSLMLVGCHLRSDDDEETFNESYFRIEAAEKWLNIKNFKRNTSSDNSLTVTATPLQSQHFAHHSEFEVRLVGRLYGPVPTATHLSVDVFTLIAIIPKSPRSLNWHIKQARRIQELASLCTGHYLPLLSLELRGPLDTQGDGKKRPREIHLYAQLINNDPGGRPPKYESVVSGPELVAASPEAIQLWCDQYEILDPAIALFFTVSSERRMFTNIRFLLAVQALEVFHRRTSGETLIPEADLPNLKASLIEAIPQGTGKAVREKLEGIYEFINEPSLNQRLKSIIADLNAEIGRRPPAFSKDYLRSFVDTRNYYTHFSESLKDKALNGSGMYWGTRRIILLLTILFLRRIGMPATSVLPLLERHREFSQLWESSKPPR